MLCHNLRPTLAFSILSFTFLVYLKVFKKFEVFIFTSFGLLGLGLLKILTGYNGVGYICGAPGCSAVRCCWGHSGGLHPTVSSRALWAK